MTPEELKSRGGLHVERITDGFEQFDSQIAHMGERQAAECMRRLKEENGEEASFLDFYYHFLDDAAKEQVLLALDEEQREYVRRMDAKGELILPLTDEMIGIAARLNDREMLFCTVYFTKTPCTLWGNYKQEYVIFTKKRHQETEEEQI